MNEKERNCVHVNEISSVFFNKKIRKTCTRAKNTCTRAKIMCIRAKKGEKYVHLAEKSMHLGKYFKLYFSKCALRGDFYIRKIGNTP